ncbi:TMEM175 family protein [Pseudotenacibaculum haliotis]|uniref:TMEM175 family protein n=1 Tax=Pseudotenacibaculum haliotis TaxID=1862138 RepID=A0ABW5LMU9_9FLAO
MLFSHSKNRLEALSDGVFAFAATLMVVEVGTSTEFISFKDEIPNFISFGASFFIMMALWKLHYNFFRRTKYVDNWIITFNMVLLFTVLFYIFPVKSLLDSLLKRAKMSVEEFSQLFQVYSIGFALIFVCFALMYYRAYKKDKKVKNSMWLYFYTRHFSIFVLVGLTSAILAKFHIGLQYGFPGFFYGILGPLCYWHSIKFQKKYSLD